MEYRSRSGPAASVINLSVNEDIKSRVTYSVLLAKLAFFEFGADEAVHGKQSPHGQAGRGASG